MERYRHQKVLRVLVPFYRGAVVFDTFETNKDEKTFVLVPFYRGAVVFRFTKSELAKIMDGFSSPFIEERLYLEKGE